MQALMFLAIFTLLFSVMGSLIVGSGDSTEVLKQSRVRQTQEFFRDVEKVINDITRNEFQGAPYTGSLNNEDLGAYINSRKELAQLGSWWLTSDRVRQSTTAVDAFGMPLEARMRSVKKLIHKQGDDNSVTVPVGLFVLVSGGPNRVIETRIPDPITETNFFGIIAPQGSDDIVYTFTNEIAQRKNLAVLQGRLEKVATAQFRLYQSKITKVLKQVIEAHKDELAEGTMTMEQLEEILKNKASEPVDPNNPDAATFLSMENDENRQQLGIDDELNMIERDLDPSGITCTRQNTPPMPGGYLSGAATGTNSGCSRILLSAELNPNVPNQMKLKLQSDPNNPSPWGDEHGEIKFTLVVNGVGKD